MAKKLGLERGKQGSNFTLTITAPDGRYQYRSSKSWQVDNAEREAKRDPDAFLTKLKSGNISGAYRLREDFTMTDVRLPLCEIGPEGITRQAVQRYYDRQRLLGLSIQDAVRGTQFALNLRELQASPDGKKIVYFTEDNSPEAFARAINSTADQWNNGFMSEPTFKSHVISLWGTVKKHGLIDAVRPLVTSDRARALSKRLQEAIAAHSYTVLADITRGDTRRQLVTQNNEKYGIVTYHEPSDKTNVLWFKNEATARRMFTSASR